MAEASDAPSVAVDTVVYVARSIWSVQWSWYAVRAARLVVMPLSLVTVPLSYVFEVLLVVFAPLIYLVAFLVASVQGFLSLLVGLKVCHARLYPCAPPKRPIPLTGCHPPPPCSHYIAL